MSDGERKPFTVAAGKLEDNDDEQYLNTGKQFYKNYKYIESFVTLDEALVAYRTCRDYHFSELEFTDNNGVTYEITLDKKD